MKVLLTSYKYNINDTINLYNSYFKKYMIQI